MLDRVSKVELTTLHSPVGLILNPAWSRQVTLHLHPLSVDTRQTVSSRQQQLLENVLWRNTDAANVIFKLRAREDCVDDPECEAVH